MNEKDLAEACRRGEEVAYKELYDTFSHSLYGVCRRYMGNSADADDVFQDGFISIISGIGKFSYRGKGSLKAWATKVMMNTALMSLRNRGKMEIPSDNLIETEPEVETEEVASVPEDVLKDFILRLPDGYRTVFNMAVFEKMSHKEIAQALNISKVTSASQLMRAKRALAKNIKEYLSNE
ncbi:MAG: sigma-70 family RNA polymerase sigma factor [Bacteroidales bacterium]|nr:sigma-70 family RNA polymerase sigma factor [Bacteroidales bacterium]